jgi:hypothetical protein
MVSVKNTPEKPTVPANENERLAKLPDYNIIHD